MYVPFLVMMTLVMLTTMVSTCSGMVSEIIAMVNVWNLLPLVKVRKVEGNIV